MDISKLPRLSQTPDSSAKEAPAVAAPDAMPVTVVCPHCGGVMPVDSKFCNDCGGRLGDRADYVPVPDAGVGGEAWLSAIIGVVFLFLGRTFGSFLLAKSTGQAFHSGFTWQTGEMAGREVDYFAVQGYQAISDMGIFLFGVVLLFEALVVVVQSMSGRRQPVLLMAAIAITLLTTGFNVYVVVKLLSVQITPLISLLAIGFGGYIAFVEWRMLGVGARRRA